MKITASKENSTPSHSSKPFFSEKGEGGFWGQTKETERPFFTPAISRQAAVWGGGNAQHTPFFQARSQSVIQPKLTINEPGDRYEQEADAMSDRVMRMSDPVSAGGDENLVQTKPLNINSIQRKCTACAEEEKVQRQETPTKPLMRKVANGGYTASPQLSSQLNSSKGGGDPLPDKTLASMNQAFSADFSTVRVHTGRQAAEMSQGIQAKAFTHGSDIYFNQGQYSPSSSEGKRLLAHELVHVGQQGLLGSPSSIQRDDIKTQKKATEDPIAMKEKEALQIVADVESGWKGVRSAGQQFAKITPWLILGDTVVSLVRTHVIEGFAAIKNGDLDLSALYKQVVESDLVMYNVIAWQVVVYANLLGASADLSDWHDTFKADDREFRGREKAVEYVNLLLDLLRVFPGQSDTLFKQLDVNQKIIVKRNGVNILTITATNAYSNKAVLEKESKNLEQVAIGIQLMVENINAFANNAFYEGLEMAGQALIEFYQARGQGRGRGPKVNKSTPKRPSPTAQSKPTPKPAAPAPVATPKPATPAPVAAPKPAAPAPAPATPAPKPAAPAPAPASTQKPPSKPAQQKQKPPKQQKQRRGITCFGRSFVLQIPSALPNNVCSLANQRIDGPSVTASNQNAACVAAKHAFNAMMPRGCRPKHLKCVC